MSISLEAFIESVTTSGLMDSDDIHAFLGALPLEHRPRTAEDLARELYKHGRLTKFQAQAIYQKKTRGLVVGNYVVLDKLGKGGMGAVYKAQHKRMKRIVALKMLPSSATKSSDSVKRFQREVEAAAKLTHPNIVTAYDADDAKGVYFLVMEYVEGQDLYAFVKDQGTLSAARAVDYLVQVAKGLQYAHSQGVIHRDIKPHNLLLDKAGTVKILDMGLARIEETVAGSDAAADEGLTQSGQVMGTLDYMPPEQALDTSTVDVRADIYSLGCTLHYLLIGRPPYSGDTIGKKIVAHRENPIPSLHALRSDIPPSLDAVFQKMLAKRPDDRQQSMTEVISQLQGCSLPQSSFLAAPSFPPASGSYSETIDLKRDETAPPVPLSSPLDELFAGESVQISERLIAPSRRYGKRWTNQQKILVGSIVGGTAVVLLLLGIALKGGGVGTNKKTAVKTEAAAAKETPNTGVTVVNSNASDSQRGLAEPPAGQSTGLPTESPNPTATSGDTPPRAVAPFDATKAKQHQEAWSKHLGVPMEETNFIGMKLILIPPGEFMMGSTPEQIAWAVEEGKKNDKVLYWYFDAIATEAIQHHVGITKPFHLGVYEVTQAEYETVVGGNPSQFKINGRQPVENVSWFDAVAFCNRLSEREKMQPYYKIDGQTVSVLGGSGYRLPTEAEWEYACRAGTTTKWHFGDDGAMLGDYAWYEGNSGGKPHIVGEKKPNPWGLYDMHGNVLEWCWDFQRAKNPYEATAVTDPMGLSNGEYRVIRSESFNYGSEYVRSAFRLGNVPDFRKECGFRLARTCPTSGAKQASPSDESVKPNQTSDKAFVNLFDGKTLNGWHKTGVGDWSVEKGAIVGQNAKAHNGFGHLVTDTKYGDFTVRLKFKVPKGNSGVYFRCEEKGYSGIVGPQVDIFPPQYVGSFWETHAESGGRQLVDVAPEAVGKCFKPDDWNDLRLEVRGNRVLSFINQVKTAQWQQDHGPMKGPLAIQMAGDVVELTFKDIAIADLDGKASQATGPGRPGSTSTTPRANEDRPPPAIAPFDATTAKQHQEAWAKHLGVPLETTNSIGMKMALIPPGKLNMGSTAEHIALGSEEGKADKGWEQWYSAAVPNEIPQHPAEVATPFWLGVREVTQAEYQRVVGSNPSQFKIDLQLPIESISWLDAVAFCNRLSESERLQPCYRVDGGSVSIIGDHGYRLPSEVEWEHACRAGTTTKWSFGDDGTLMSDHGWHVGNSDGKTHRVGEKKPNPWGLYDIHGNVWEWCWDEFRKYDADGKSPGAGHAIRGGAFESRALVLRSAVRLPCGSQSNNVGFRLARTCSNVQAEPPSPAISPAESEPAQPSPADSKRRAIALQIKDWVGLPQCWKITRQAILGSTGPQGIDFNTFLCTKKTYRNFELTCQVRFISGNTGIQFRSDFDDRDRFVLRGPQVDIAPGYWGNLYGERTGGTLKAAPEDLVKRAVKDNDFNDVSLRSVGKHVTIKINNETMVDGDFPNIPDEGLIGLQLHAGKTEAMFRNIRVKELD